MVFLSEAVGRDKPSCDDWRFLMWDYVSIRHQKVKSALTTKREMCCQDASEPRWRAGGGGRRRSAQKAPVCLFVPKNCDAEKQKIVPFKRSPSIYWRGLQELMSHNWTKMHRNRVGTQNTVAAAAPPVTDWTSPDWDEALCCSPMLTGSFCTVRQSYKQAHVVRTTQDTWANWANFWL